MSWVTSDRVVRARAVHPLIDVGVGTIAGFQRHQTPRNAAVLTYFGFLSIFPLFMVATAVLGFVLQGNEQLQEDILDTFVAQIPVIGSEIERAAGDITGSTTTVIIGLLITLWAATRAFAGLQNALDDVWEVPLDRRHNLAVRRLRSVVAIIVIGGSLILTSAVASIVSVGAFPVVSRVLLAAAVVTVNTAVLAFMYRFMTAASVTWSAVWPGALLGGFGFAALQFGGTFIVQRFLATASDTAGVFATVFALMAWLNLHAMVSLIGAELNGAILRRRARMDDFSLWVGAAHLEFIGEMSDDADDADEAVVTRIGDDADEVVSDLDHHAPDPGS